MTISPELLHLISAINYCLGYCTQRLIDDKEAQIVIDAAMRAMNGHLKAVLEKKE
jgi:hypothetical protein